jgi:rhamnosyltransferase
MQTMKARRAGRDGTWSEGREHAEHERAEDAGGLGDTREARVDVIDVVVRCRNEMPFTARTLDALARQKAPRARVLFIDCTSTDGSREAAEEVGARIVDLAPEAYVPGRALNTGMQMTRSPVVAFVNADAIPQGEGALARLIAPLLRGDLAAASFGRQIARPDADGLTKLDYARAFGASAPARMRRGAFFSMAASAVRRDVWEALPFDDALRYSEDVDWTQRAAALGWTVAYVPEAVFEHSHSYDLRAHLKRRAGEGAADKAIFRLGAPSIVGDLVRPLAGALVRDARSGALSPKAIAVRVAQAAGYFSGRRSAAQG